VGEKLAATGLRLFLERKLPERVSIIMIAVIESVSVKVVRGAANPSVPSKESNIQQELNHLGFTI